MNIAGCRGGSRPNLSAMAVLSPTIRRRTCQPRAYSCRPTLAATRPTIPVRPARSRRTATGGPAGRHWTRSAAAPSSMSPEATGSAIRLSGRVGHVVKHRGNGQDQDVVLARSDFDTVGVPDAKPSLGNLGDLRAVLLDRVFMIHDVALNPQVRAIFAVDHPAFPQRRDHRLVDHGQPVPSGPSISMLSLTRSIRSWILHSSCPSMSSNRMVLRIRSALPSSLNTRSPRSFSIT